MPSHYRGTEEEQRALSLFISLTRAANSLQHAAHSRAPLPEGLTLSQFGVLEALLHRGPLSQRDVGQKLLTSKGNVSVVVAHLEERGLVERCLDPQDRRKKRISLTSAGRTLIASYFPQLAAQFAEACRVLAPEEQVTLTDLCRSLGRGIDEGMDMVRTQEDS